MWNDYATTTTRAQVTATGRSNSPSWRCIILVREWLLQTGGFGGRYAGSGEGESDEAVLFCYWYRDLGGVKIISGNKDEPQGMGGRL